jgi:hypothetical protein
MMKMSFDSGSIIVRRTILLVNRAKWNRARSQWRALLPDMRQ